MRTFLALKIRGHIETMCWGPVIRSVCFLVFSAMTLVVLDFCLLVLQCVPTTRADVRGYAWPSLEHDGLLVLS